jgi:hypothetical protein
MFLAPDFQGIWTRNSAREMLLSSNQPGNLDTSSLAEHVCQQQAHASREQANAANKCQLGKILAQVASVQTSHSKIAL